jgi:hypothetical protein
MQPFPQALYLLHHFQNREDSSDSFVCPKLTPPRVYARDSIWFVSFLRVGMVTGVGASVGGLGLGGDPVGGALVGGPTHALQSLNAWNSLSQRSGETFPNWRELPAWLRVAKVWSQHSSLTSHHSTYSSMSQTSGENIPGIVSSSFLQSLQSTPSSGISIQSHHAWYKSSQVCSGVVCEKWGEGGKWEVMSIRQGQKRNSIHNWLTGGVGVDVGAGVAGGVGKGVGPGVGDRIG